MSSMSSMTSTHDSADQGSFSMGFTLGIFAGAMGYFLFATDRGSKVRSELAREWTQARRELMNSELGAEAKEALPSLKQMLYKVADHFVTVTKTSKKSSPAKAKTARKTFKGT